jgi:hypothetical protein
MSLQRGLISGRVSSGRLLVASPATVLDRYCVGRAATISGRLTRLLGMRNRVESAVTARDRNPS